MRVRLSSRRSAVRSPCPSRHLDTARGADRVQHAAVVGDQQQRALVGVERRLQLLDGGQVEVVRRLVQDQQVDAPALEQRQRRAGALARGQGGRRAQHVVRLQAELGQQGADFGRFRLGDRRAERVQQRLGRRGTARGPGRPRRPRRPEPSAAWPASSGTRPSRAPSRVDLPAPLAPVMATRSAQSIWRSTGPKAKSPRRTSASAQGGDHRAGARRRRDLHPQLPLLAGLLDHVEALDHALGLAGLRGLLLARLAAELAADLVVVGRLAAGVLDALVHPGALHLGPALERGPLVGVLLEVLAGVPAGASPAPPGTPRSRRRTG